MAGKRIYLTDGAGIFKIKKLVRAAVLINLETKETVIAEVLGSQVAGFAIVKLPGAEEIAATPETPGEAPNQHEPIKGKGRKKSSRYYGVSAVPNSKKNPWRHIYINDEHISLGGFPKAEAAQEKKPHTKRKYKKRKSKSGYHGVSAVPNSKKNPWRAVIFIDGKRINIGGFPTDVAAAKAVDAELIKRGKPARNFPQARKEG